MIITHLLRAVYLLSLCVVPFLTHELILDRLFVTIVFLSCLLAPRLFALLLFPMLSSLMAYATHIQTYSDGQNLLYASALVAAYCITLLALNRKNTQAIMAGLQKSIWVYSPGAAMYLSILLLFLAIIAALNRDVSLSLGLASVLIALSIVWHNRHLFPRPTRREFVQNAALLFVSVLVCLIFLELVCANFFWYFPQQNKVFKHTPNTWFASRPGYHGKVPYITDSSTERRFVDVKINSQGLRESYEVGPKTEKEFRILLLGDSYSFGYSLEANECLDAALERLLNDSPGDKRVEVLNAGVSGYAPWQEHTWLVEHGLALEPDAILVQSFASNDVSQSLFRSDPEVLHHLPVFEDHMLYMAIRYRLCTHWQMRLDTYFNDNFHLYHTLKTLFKRPFLALDILNGTRLVPQLLLPKFPSSSPKEFWNEGDLKEWYPILTEAWNLYIEDILKISKTAEGAGIPLLLFDIPYPFEHEDYEDAILEKFEADKLNKLVERFFKESQLDHVPLLDKIRTYPNPGVLYYHQNSHLTPAGIDYIAQPIAEKIRQQWLSP